ncbi:arginine--tRNA ligase [Candidatus Peregrinibacteria bacterium HGW-Peregrinibacteria-1]|jgi:arginyl-tRNA synthetase|nr:MAG: arginine--tRNA ligase [Candidatus Peregrinibacteria bacterium HGW-Peregrinibacteria-1]
MKFSVDQKIFESFPDFKMGVILIKNFDNSRKMSSVEGLFRGVSAQRGKEFAVKKLNEDAMVAVWDRVYGNLGVNPDKKLSGFKELLRAAKAEESVEYESALKDLSRYFALKYKLPVVAHDLDWICGDLWLKFTDGGEPFRMKNSVDVEDAKEGEAGYVDAGGIICRYWNADECERTNITRRTVNAVLFIEDMSKIHADQFGEMLKEIQDSVSKYLGGSVESYVLGHDHYGVDMGIHGRVNMNDSKIPAQEKAYFEMKKRAELSASEPVKDAAAAVKKVKKSKPKRSLELSDADLLSGRIKVLLMQGVLRAFASDVDESDFRIKVEQPNDSENGDYACGVAFQLAKILKMSPLEVATNIKNSMPINDLVDRVEVAGNGFINFFLDQRFLENEVAVVLEKREQYGKLRAGANKKIIVEYSSPNIAKPLGVHHLLSTVIGQSLHNILNAVGFDAIAINHLGDWGTQFGKLIVAYKRWGKKKSVEKNPINELLSLYVRFHDAAEKDPALEDEARHEFKIFEEGDSENRALWKWFVEVSIDDLRNIYDRLGNVHFDYYQGESFYEPMLADLLKEGKENGVFVEGNEGAFVVMFDDENMSPLVVQKKDGATLYSTRDLAALKYRIDTFKPEKILYVVDVAQTLHFKQLFTAVEGFDWYGDEGEHISFGRMQMKEGRMSTRKGNIVRLEDVVDEAEKRAVKVVKEKNPKLKDKELVGHEVGVGAVKYSVLSQNRTTDIVFDWERMLSLEGNSGPYLQYTYARAKSILRKSQEVGEMGNFVEDGDDVAGKTRNVVAFLPKFQEALLMAAKEYKPNLISNYLYDLAQRFNSFYNNVPVLKSEDKEKREARLKIVEATAQVMKNGLMLLGINVVEEM